MILSFHPLFTGDKNILCAGRKPDNSDLAAIREASAVILPQGCSKALYIMARANCKNVFPNFDARFSYPGKIGQIKLFRLTGQKYPRTLTFNELLEFNQTLSMPTQTPPFQYPFVFKFDWGGEGETVYRISNPDQFKQVLNLADTYEKTGQKGFLIQEFIPEARKTLRCAVIGENIFTYRRIQKEFNKFKSNLSDGGKIDQKVSPLIKRRTESALKSFLEKTRINLAGFDFIYTSEHENPLFLEINYFFGRKGIGGSEAYYKLLCAEIAGWIKKRVNI